MLALLIYLVAVQLQLSTITGTVVDDSGGAMPGVTLQLTDPLGAMVASTATDSAGRFRLAGVAPGRYQLRGSMPGFMSIARAIDMASALPLELSLRMQVGAVSAVIVDVAAGPDTPSTRAALAGDSLAQIPVRAIGRGIQDAVASLPGWATEDNGLLHVRGTDDGFLYVIDGVPVYERLDQLSSIGPDLTTVESINVRTGYVPAEFGHKAGGVIDVRTRPVTSDWNGSLQADHASERNTWGSATVGGPLTTRLSMMIGAAAQRSDRFLDPVHPDNLHNTGHLRAVSSQIMWLRDDRDIVTASFNAGRSAFDVPNTEIQEAAGQDQRQRLANLNASFNWQRVWRANALSQIAGYVRHSSAALDGSAFDTPISANADRTLQRVGVIAGVSRRFGSNDVKAGIEVQRLTLEEEFGFEGDAQLPINAFTFADRATPSLWSAFAQSDWQATDRLTVSGGLRFDESRMLVTRRQLSPRAGFALRVADSTVVRGSASRFFQPPQPENLLLASSEAARVLSPFAGDDDAGGADVEPERQWGLETGVDHRIGAIRVDVAAWYRFVSNAADPNVFAGTTIVFPNAVAEGRARGVDVRIEASASYGWSGYLNAAIGRVTQKGPIVGGLFLEDEVADIADGDEFIPDHDQRLVAGGGLTWHHAASRATVTASVRHESGTPIQRFDEDADELSKRPGAELVDFEQGRVRPRTLVSVIAELPVVTRGRRSVALRASAVNLFDARYAYNFGNPFSGTHFGAPRTVSAGLRIRF